MLDLVDGDIVAHRVAWASQDVALHIAYARVDEMMAGIFKDTKADSHRTFLTDSQGNFRLKLYAEYKANRKAGPLYLQEIKNYLIMDYEAEVTYGEEADDALGIHQTENTIICSIDKDLLQIPGHHYNFVTKEAKVVTETEGLRAFYRQLAMGDSGDNITGIPGIGKAKATKIIGDSTTEEDLFRKVYEAYDKYFTPVGVAKEEWEGIMLLWGRLVKIRTRKDEIWTFPKLSENQKPSLVAEH